ncbi:MAG: hypothetical protein ACKOW9_05345 [Candidatus Paceibacterota bacterium]
MGFIVNKGERSVAQILGDGYVSGHLDMHKGYSSIKDALVRYRTPNFSSKFAEYYYDNEENALLLLYGLALSLMFTGPVLLFFSSFKLAGVWIIAAGISLVLLVIILVQFSFGVRIDGYTEKRKQKALRRILSEDKWLESLSSKVIFYQDEYVADLLLKKFKVWDLSKGEIETFITLSSEQEWGVLPLVRACKAL